MNPSRFYTKYLLAKLYDETGQREKAILTANALLQMQIKVPSTAVDEIKEEMQNIIIKYKGKNWKDEFFYRYDDSMKSRILFSCKIYADTNNKIYSLYFNYIYI